MPAAQPPASLDHIAGPALVDPTLAAERDHLAASRAALRRMRERTEQVARTARGGDPVSDAYLHAALYRRMRALEDDPPTPLFFGRLDFTAESAYPGESHHVEVVPREGSVGLIVAGARVERMRRALQRAGIPYALLGDPADQTGAWAVAHLDLVPAALAKGLEFDHVVLVEPAEIVAGEPTGLRRLYVCLTRAVTSLTVVHREALPAALATAPSSPPG